jgi:hypothetical protein
MAGAPATPSNNPAPAAGPSKNPKRSAADPTAPRSAAGSIDDDDGGPGVAKRRRTAAAEPAVLTQRIAVLEATVASHGRRIAELEAENATLEAENATLRKRPRLVPGPATLQRLVNTLGRHEPDLRDLLFELVCMPRHLARCAAELPANPAGVLGTFAVMVPTGTTAIARDAFTKCAGLAQVTLPATVVAIEAGAWVDFDEDDDEEEDEEEDEDRGEFRGAFSSCQSLSEIVLPPNLTEIGELAFCRCTSLTEIILPPNLTKVGLSAFDGCASLSVIVLPAGPVDVGAYAFRNCPGTPRRPGD